MKVCPTEAMDNINCRMKNNRNIEDDESVISEGEPVEGDSTALDFLFVSKNNTIWGRVSCQPQNTRAQNTNIVTIRPFLSLVWVE